VTEQAMKLLDLIQPNWIIPELRAVDRNGAIRELVQLLADTGALEQRVVDSLVKSIVTRERTRGTTGFGKGVAVPHAKLEGLSRVVAAVGRSSRGIDFASLDGEPVFAVFLIISPAERPEEHLRAMDLVFRHLQQEKFRKFLRQSDGADKIYDLLKEADERMLVA
jgi:mannitol/fructose-specific phosphotransferase system IIA component (Ntr-type)